MRIKPFLWGPLHRQILRVFQQTNKKDKPNQKEKYFKGIKSILKITANSVEVNDNN